jgi:hypothetical protein
MADNPRADDFDARIAFAAARARTGMPRPVVASWGGWGAVACPRARAPRQAQDRLIHAADDLPGSQGFGGE